MWPLRAIAIIPAATLAIFAYLSFGSRAVQTEKPGESSDIERGRYLVEEVAKCGE
jgi:hypothetical protein